MVFDIAIANYNTAAHLFGLLRSIEEHVPLDSLGTVHVWDNGSVDASREMLRALAPSRAWLHVHASPGNVQHGPAIDALLRRYCRSDWVLVLDSDTLITDNFVDAVSPLAREDVAFVGLMNRTLGYLYASLAHLLVNRRLYLRLPPWTSEGAPALDYFNAIEARRLVYAAFPWRRFAVHLGQATLRDIVERGERAHPLYAFAVDELPARPKTPARIDRERESAAGLKQLLEQALPGGPVPADRWDEPPAPTGAVGRRARSLIRRAGRDFARSVRHVGAALAVRRAEWRGLVQRNAEIRTLLDIVWRAAPRRVLEIGTAFGGSLYLWSRVVPADAELISIDLPPAAVAARAGRARVATLSRRRQSVHLLHADSHAASTLAEVRRRLGSAPLDFLFIDGDHSLDGVRADFEMYAPLVRSGGLVALHDIHPHSERWGGDVPQFWCETRDRYDHREIIADPHQDGFGIGLIWMP
jgi:predicted O-methyltransferase YrrM